MYPEKAIQLYSVPPPFRYISGVRLAWNSFSDDLDIEKQILQGLDHVENYNYKTGVPQHCTWNPFFGAGNPFFVVRSNP